MYTRTISPPAPKPKSANELLAEVLADPEADAPRMVYADWLTQAGDPRGEFIALQLERDRLGEGAPAQLAERKAELLKKHKKAWVGEFACTRIEYGFEGGGDYVRGTPTKCHFRRGFVDSVDMQVFDFIRNAPGVFAREPLRRYHPTSGSVTQLFAEGTALERLRVLDFQPWKFHGTELREVAIDAKCTRLEELVLTNCKIGTAAMIEFATHAVEKPSLRVLRAGWNAFGDKGALVLAASPILRSLTKLQLRSSKITAKGKSVLEASVRKAVELEL